MLYIKAVRGFSLTVTKSLISCKPVAKCIENVEMDAWKLENGAWEIKNGTRRL